MFNIFLTVFLFLSLILVLSPIAMINEKLGKLKEGIEEIYSILNKRFDDSATDAKYAYHTIVVAKNKIEALESTLNDIQAQMKTLEEKAPNSDKKKKGKKKKGNDIPVNEPEQKTEPVEEE